MFRDANQVIKPNRFAVQRQIVKLPSLHRLADTLFGDACQNVHDDHASTRPDDTISVVEKVS